MCKRHQLAAILMMALPALGWADLIHPSVSPTGLPTLSAVGSVLSDQDSQVQIFGSSIGDGANALSIQVSSGLDGSQNGNNSLTVEYSGTGDVYVNTGSSMLPMLPTLSTLGLGLGQTLPMSLGLGASVPSLGLMGLGSLTVPSTIGLGMQTHRPIFIGQPVMMQRLLP